MKLIEISYKGNKKYAYAKIDDENYDEVSKYKWCAFVDKTRNTIYAIKREHNTKMISMHRLIMKATKGTKIDHKNGDGLDNQKQNLRFANNSENRSNSKTPKNNSLHQKNISWSSGIKKFRVGIKKTFDSEDEFKEKIQELQQFDALLSVYKYENFRLNVLKKFDNLDDAILCAQKLRKILHGDFARQ